MLRRSLASLPIHRPRTLVVVALVLAVLGGLAYGFALEIRTNRRQLSDPDRPLNQRTEAYRQAFRIEDEVLVCLAASAPGDLRDAPPLQNGERLQAKRLLREVAARLSEDERWFPGAAARAEPVDGGPLALLYLEPEAFDAAITELTPLAPSLSALAADPSIDRVLSDAARQLAEVPQGLASLEPADEEALGLGVTALELVLERVVARLDTGADSEPSAFVDQLGQRLRARASLGGFDAEGFVFLAEGRIAALPLPIRGDPGTPNEYGAATDRLREVLDDVVGDRFASGVVGLPALEAAEVRTSQRDFTRGAVIALVLVCLLFGVAFRSLRRPLLAALCLGLSVGITFLFTYLVLGHLNLVAMVFAIVLVALGVDFAIHFATHYERGLASGLDAMGSVRQTLRDIGPALWLGGATTACAFLSAAVTEAPGFSELGLIAGGGLLICLLVMVLVYPALLIWAEQGRQSRAESRMTSGTADVIEPKARPGGRSRALLVVGGLLAALGLALGQREFDTNLLSLQPVDGVEAQWMRRVVELDDRTQFAVATFADRESLEEVRQRFSSDSGLVAETRSVFPIDEASRRDRLASLGEEFSEIALRPAEVPALRSLRRAVFRLRSAIRSLQQRGDRAEAGLSGLFQRVESLRSVLDRLRDDGDTTATSQRLGDLQRVFEAGLSEVLSALRTLTSPPTFDVSLAPEPLRRRTLAMGPGVAEPFALEIVPAFSTWEEGRRGEFVERALAIEPALFGGVISLHDNSEVMVRSFRIGTWLALAVVTLLTIVGTRSVRLGLLALLPLVAALGLLGLAMRFGPTATVWNFANFFALSILIGIGVDAGIHLCEAFERGETVFRSSRRAVLVSGLTTWTGFAVLALSEHLGVRSLGQVLTLGITFLLVTSLLGLPILLRWAGRRDRTGDSPSDAGGILADR